MDDTQKLLNTRNNTHGPFRLQFACAQEIKAVYDKYLTNGINPVQKECLDQIAHKQSRILTGNSTFADHWDDIAGYAKLGSQMCDDEA
jgi:hypothetical protein